MLRRIETVVDAATAADIWVRVCGGIAGEPEGALMLAGLGVRELSMTIPSVAAVKARLRRSIARRSADSQTALCQCATAGEVRELALP